MAPIDTAARTAWAAELRKEREGRRGWASEERPMPPGFPMSWWDERAKEQAKEGDEPWDYEWHTERFMENWYAGAQGKVEVDTHWYGGSHSYQEGLGWLEANDKAGWWNLNRQLVEQNIAPGRGRQGPFYPNQWWYETEYESERPGVGTNPTRTLTVPEAKLPRDLNQRIVLCALTHVRGALVRWAVRRKMGRTTDEFYDDCGGELGSVGSCYVPWDGGWLNVKHNGTGQEGHGYSKHFAIRVGDWGEEQIKLNHKQIVPLARRVFKVPDIYRESVDAETGQATLF
jgi:hypothetical protein